jgi:hypothetical protein
MEHTKFEISLLQLKPDAPVWKTGTFGFLEFSGRRSVYGHCVSLISLVILGYIEH